MPRALYGGVQRAYYFPSLEERDSREECWTCMVIPITFWIFVSLTLSLGFYGSSHLELGPNYSRLVEANSIFVNEIQVKYEGQEEGPTLYGFSHRPKLGVDQNWTLQHTLLIDPEYHQEFALWLNRGSKIRLRCSVRAYGFFNLLLVVLKGGDSLQEWLHDPANPHSGVIRMKMHGHGEAEYVVQEDANYYFAVANFNQQSVEVVMRMNLTSKMYDTQTADYKCSMHSGFCGVKLVLFGHKYAVLTTPINKTDALDVWHVELSYGARVVTYMIILGIVILVTFCALRILGKIDEQFLPQEIESERSPLLLPKESTSGSSTYGTIEQDQESGLLRSTEDLYDGKICVVCYDQPRNCFFIPCGHCATCYTCGQRIENGENKSCPICRQGISKVRQMFNV